MHAASNSILSKKPSSLGIYLCMGQSVMEGVRCTVPCQLIRSKGHAIYQGLEQSWIRERKARSALQTGHHNAVCMLMTSSHKLHELHYFCQGIQDSVDRDFQAYMSKIWTNLQQAIDWA